MTRYNHLLIIGRCFIHISLIHISLQSLTNNSSSISLLKCKVFILYILITVQKYS